MADIKRLWSEFGDIPISDDDELESAFHGWPKGTPRMEVDGWFDEKIPGGLGPALESGKLKNPKRRNAGGHTPGPWELKLQPATLYPVVGTVVKAGERHSIANVFRNHDDARLIAAAPDLLAALRDVELRLTQARLASTIGKQKGKADFLLGEIGRVGDVASAAIRKAGASVLVEENPTSHSTEDLNMKTKENANAKKTETSQAPTQTASAPPAPQPAAAPSAVAPASPAGTATSANPPSPATPPPKSETQAPVGGAVLPETGAAPNPAPATDATPAPTEAPKTDGTSPNPPAEAPAAPAQEPSVEAAAVNPAAPAEGEKKVETWSQTETNGKKRVHRKKRAAMRSAKFLRGKGARARVEPVAGGWAVFVDGKASKPGPKAKRSNPISAVTVVNEPSCPKDGTRLQRTQVVIENSPKRPELRGKFLLRCGKCGSQYGMR